MSENKQTGVPGLADENRPCWQEEGSLNSTVVSGADVGVCGGRGAAPDSNSARSGGEQNMHIRRD